MCVYAISYKTADLLHTARSACFPACHYTVQIPPEKLQAPGHFGLKLHSKGPLHFLTGMEKQHGSDVLIHTDTVGLG